MAAPEIGSGSDGNNLLPIIVQPEAKAFAPIDGQYEAFDYLANPNYRLSSALKLKEPPVMYVENRASLTQEAPFKLAEGQLRFGAPRAYEELLQNPSYWQEHILRGKEYRDPDLEQGIEFVRERFGISDEPYVTFSDGGSDRLLRSLTSLFSSEEESKVNYFGPCFPNVINFVKSRIDRNSHLNSVKMEAINGPLNESSGQVLLDTLTKFIAGDPDKIPHDQVFYLCNPTTPKGEIIDPGIVDLFARFCSISGNTFIIDEAFGEAMPDEESAILLTDHYPNLIVTRSLSKMIGLAGERIGYAVMSTNEGEKYEEWRKSEHYDIPTPKQILINKIMNPGILQPHVDSVRLKAKNIKEELMEFLDNNNIAYLPTDARVPILTLVGNQNGFYQRLKEEGVDSSNGAGFAETHHDMSDMYARIAIPPTTLNLINLMRRIKSASTTRRSA